MTSKFSSLQVFTLLLVTILGVIWSVSFHEPLVVGFSPGYLVLFLLALKKKYSFKVTLMFSLKGIQKTKVVIIILSLVSVLLPSWYLAGTIDQMVKVALYIIHPHHFFLLTFLVAMAFSMLLGTTVGTLSAIGIPILSTAVVLQLPPEIVAGALVSGAFVGDRTSPFSSSHQLLSHTVEVTVSNQWKAMLVTSIIAIVICFSLYGVLDYLHTNKSAIHHHSFSLGEVSVFTFIPPLVLIGMVVCRLSIIYAFLFSILSAVMIAFVNGVAFSEIIPRIWFGVEGLGGGFVHIYELLLFLVLAGAYNGLIEKLNVIQPYLDKWLQSSHSLMSDTLRTLLATLLISVIAANQTLPIILTGRSFLPHWTKKYGKEELARVMGDSTMLFPGMIPWSVLAIMCSTIVGIPLIEYLPYAFFLWGLPFLTIVISFLKQVLKRNVKTATAA
ncbi:NhaC family Na+:H+ antiporter [Bacillus sp. SORGH_AS 510]|uniref:Na+/H+ antiporter NhaC family protein n=1 Tax=Bacillus sp. SORGH_AS_0510 TaxID=3041771 RepID=UPI002782B515|nr:Na+/H+ antiporter NhaC family protein [Bacillus sp. SORGH_AS_0510]MDQ1145595.1 NhaC family Na+:H+ antiporter [Bacillus sp. SORGH_AS_0510]